MFILFFLVFPLQLFITNDGKFQRIEPMELVYIHFLFRFVHHYMDFFLYTLNFFIQNVDNEKKTKVTYSDEKELWLLFNSLYTHWLRFDGNSIVQQKKSNFITVPNRDVVLRIGVRGFRTRGTLEKWMPYRRFFLYSSSEQKNGRKFPYFRIK